MKAKPQAAAAERPAVLMSVTSELTSVGTVFAEDAGEPLLLS